MVEDNKTVYVGEILWKKVVIKRLYLEAAEPHSADQPGAECRCKECLIRDGSITTIIKMQVLSPGVCPKGYKCRVPRVKVLECPETCISEYDRTFEYTEGDIVEVKNYNNDATEECNPGIHGFRNWADAKEYRL